MEVPVDEIKGEKWLILKNVLGKKVVFRADSIEKKKERISDPSGHRMDEAVAEGSVKCKCKYYNIKDAKL